MANPDQGMDIGMIPRDPDAYSDQVDDRHQARDRGQAGDSARNGTGDAGGDIESRDSVLDADAMHTLEHGGYGGEQEYADSATDDRSRPQVDDESGAEGQ